MGAACAAPEVKEDEMTIDDFLWRDEIVDKLAAKHSVEAWEVEEVFDNSPHIRFRQRGNRPGEDLYSASAQTNAGRYLIVYFIYKPPHENRPSRQAFIVSARDMTDQERKQHERK